jgi:putative transposase
VTAVCEIGGGVALRPLCEAVGVARAGVYRRRRPAAAAPPPRPCPHRALSVIERDVVAAVLVEDRFVDRSPVDAYHTLLDEGVRHCSTRTMYRILQERRQVKERRAQRTHPEYVRPELMASGPNEVWSWDISRLRTTVPWKYLYLYVILDIFSRFVVGWMIAEHENAALAKILIEETVDRHQVVPGTLVLHADRGTQMTSKTLAQLLSDLDVGRSFSRPQVSNDNPFSESQFRTTKYEPSFPGRFAGMDDALVWGRGFFPWYNHEHRHSGIAYLTPANMHEGEAEQVLAARHGVMLEAWTAHPERFVHGRPKLVTAPTATYINPPRSGIATPQVDTCTLTMEVRQ